MASPKFDRRIMADMEARAARQEGRPYIPPERIARAMKQPTGWYYAESGDIVRALRCQECTRLGHICRPCRKRRYEARYTTPWWWSLVVLAGVLTLAAVVWWVIYG